MSTEFDDEVKRYYTKCDSGLEMGGEIVNNQLLPCPFCGSTHWCDWHAGHRERPWNTECIECGASGPWAYTEEEAKRLWNKRIQD